MKTGSETQIKEALFHFYNDFFLALIPDALQGLIRICVPHSRCQHAVCGTVVKSSTENLQAAGNFDTTGRGVVFSLWMWMKEQRGWSLFLLVKACKCEPLSKSGECKVRTQTYYRFLSAYRRKTTQRWKCRLHQLLSTVERLANFLNVIFLSIFISKNIRFFLQYYYYYFL